MIRTHKFPDAFANHWIKLVLPTEVSPWISTGNFLHEATLRSITIKKRKRTEHTDRTIEGRKKARGPVLLVIERGSACILALYQRQIVSYLPDTTLAKSCRLALTDAVST